MSKTVLLLSATLAAAACADAGNRSSNEAQREAGVPLPAATSGSGSEPLKNAKHFAETGSWLVEPKIVGGEEAKAGDDPWQVALVVGERTDRNYAFCGGSLVRANWVLTAAHCVNEGTTPAQVDVVSGTVDLDSGGVRTRVAEIIIHRDYDNGTNDNDIALLRLVGNGSGQPVNLITAAGESSVTPGTKVRVTGWGKTSQGGPSVRILRTVDVPVVSRADCNNRVSYDGKVTNNMVCAGRQLGGVDSCQGDSGGPLTALTGGGRSLFGVVSWGDGCAQPNKYGVYTRLANYTGWVANCIAGQNCLRQ